MAKQKDVRKGKIIIVLLVLFILFTSIIYLSKNAFLDNKNFEKKKTQKKTEKRVQSTKQVEKKEAKLTLVGDFLFEEPFYKATPSIENSNYFSFVESYFKEDDLSIGNMEVVIGNDSLKASGTGYNFCAPTSVGKLVSKLDLEVLSTANNHSFDRGIEGINSTLDFFKNTGILTVGTYKEKKEVDKLAILNINDIKFGFMSYTLGTNIKIPENDRWRVNLYRDPTTKEITSSIKEKMKKEVERLRNEVDVIIALVHWGQEFTSTPNTEQKTLANYLNTLGVDIIVGSHSHSIQPIEFLGEEHKTLVFYSLGNFVSADDDISRTGETYDNAYQFGLLSNLKVIKEKDSILITDIKTEPIINYFDKNMQNFKLIPYNQYKEEYETSHYRYSHNFNKKFINNMYTSVIKEEFR